MNMPSLQGVARPLAVLVTLVSVSGCATKSDIRDLSTEIRRLAVRQDSIMMEFRRMSSATQDTLREASSTLFDFRGDVINRLNSIQRDIDLLEELTRQNANDVTSVRDQLDAMRRGGARMPGSGGAPAGPMSEGGSDADALYNAAVEQMRMGTLTTARQGFVQFIELYPDHDLTPRAHYHIADILEQQGRLDEAIQRFEDLTELFPADDTVPDALYRIGLLYIEMDDLDQARAYLRRVVNTYPDNAVTPMAEERLRDIGG